MVEDGGPSKHIIVEDEATPMQTENLPNENLIPEQQKVGGKRKLTSPVWDHFTKVIIKGRQRAICHGCKKDYIGTSKSGTTHLKEHLERCIKSNQVDIRQSLLKATLTKDNPTMTVGKFKFNNEVSRYELWNMVVLHGYPLSMVDHIGFKRYSGSLNPDFKVISRNTLKKDILGAYKEEKEKLRKLIATQEGRVAITTDMWSNRHQRKGYMAVTAHFIDDDWVLQSHVIRFAYVPCPHNNETISKVLLECIVDFNLDERISTVTVDNCTTNDCVMDVLLEKLDPISLILDGRFLHMRCCAHILNLIVKDGLEIIGPAIEKIRSAVLFWTATQKRYEKFEDSCRHYKIGGGKRLECDNNTRWNSTYEMLETAIMYKDVFTRLKKNSKGKVDKFTLPSADEWQMAKEICDKLALFKRTTDAFSGTQYPTANLYFQKVCEIRLALRKWFVCGNRVIESMAGNMIAKFDKYWNTINGILAVASVLDPRRKLECVSFYFEHLYGDDSEFECRRIKKLLVDLVDDYKFKLSTYESPSNTKVIETNINSGKQTLDDVDDFENMWDKHVEDKPVQNAFRGEVDNYFEDGRHPNPQDPNFNLLTWWSINSSKYPILSKIARDILAVPVSTVASESTFSKSGKIISPHRSRLNPTTIEALMCLQSWRVVIFKDVAKKNPLAVGTVDEDVECKVEEDNDKDD